MSAVQSKNSSKIFVDLSVEELLNFAVERKEGVIAANGALSVSTGKRTGRSPKDKFIVAEPKSEKNIDWDSINQALSEERFHALWQRAEQYVKDADLFISNLQVGA
ncbi:MAG: phosphoenolpyruvate carboxykinase (ATP), partial [Candidatus Rickettsiella isopodorum]|nr:phosphoenolpyruvate carboxykinase (ATP) [Candidatus Rickettsiella isopodorum]